MTRREDSASQQGVTVSPEEVYAAFVKSTDTGKEGPNTPQVPSYDALTEEQRAGVQAVADKVNEQRGREICGSC